MKRKIISALYAVLGAKSSVNVAEHGGWSN
jgi:hypothetical protein